MTDDERTGPVIARIVCHECGDRTIGTIHVLRMTATSYFQFKPKWGAIDDNGQPLPIGDEGSAVFQVRWNRTGELPSGHQTVICRRHPDVVLSFDVGVALSRARAASAGNVAVIRAYRTEPR